VPDLTDNDAINVFTLEDAVYVATETNCLRRIDVKSLATLEKVRPLLGTVGAILLTGPEVLTGLKVLTQFL
jgi:hypothetical protein